MKSKTRLAALIAALALAITALAGAPAEAGSAGCEWTGAGGYSLPARYSFTVTTCTSGVKVKAGVKWYNSSAGSTALGPVYGTAVRSGSAYSEAASGTYFAQGTSQLVSS